MQTEFFNIFHPSGIFYIVIILNAKGGPVSKRLALEHFKIISGKEADAQNIIGYIGKCWRENRGPDPAAEMIRF